MVQPSSTGGIFSGSAFFVSAFYKGVEPKIWGFNFANHPFVHRVFHEFHHPFLGYHYIWKHPYE